MDYFTKQMKDEEFQLALAGDVHVGSLNADLRAFEATIDYCIENETYLIMMGDLVDAITPKDIRYDASNMDREHLTISEQFEYIEDELGRLKRGQLLGMVVGNHYSKWAINACSDEKIRMCKRLGARFLGLHAMYRFDMPHDSFKLSVFHGAGGGYQMGSTMNKLVQEPAKFTADVYAQGHSHNLYHFGKPILEYEEEEEDRQKRKLYINTGCYLKTYREGVGGYGESKGYSPQLIGFSCVKFKEFSRPVANDMVWDHGKFHDEDISLKSNHLKNAKREARELSKEELLELIEYSSKLLF
jgi:hypothetical protein